MILYFEALLRRLPRESSLRSKIEENLLKAWAGYHGECKVDRQLSTIDNEHMLVLNDLCIPMGESFFQIDTLILTRNFILILEIKNIAGSMEFGTQFEQFSRTLNGEVTGFPNPLSQANRYKIHLTQWLQKKKLPIIPIEFLVVFTNSSSLISTSSQSKDTLGRAIRIENLVAKLLTIQHSCSNSNSILEMKEIKKIANSLMKENAPYSNFNQQHEGIIRGVMCTLCERFNMVRNMRSWYCPDCGEFDRNAHQQAIYDYLLLVNPNITNKQAREFLGVESSRVAYHLLNNMDLSSKGKGKVESTLSQKTSAISKL
ncbi:NERD domain-containing protein [Rossellomorea aquimaris]|uniref:NERD domain-containing protein n=1 Tax=Rossellomorea aquimaris TaxID=189382 RepID=A0A5D4UF09_9BACI|nr:NERD domain-containing protein [Rossellomorea aquimaris]TYS85744.1 NERD domain-containing protein [Rossellomorea aquimaris]